MRPNVEPGSFDRSPSESRHPIRLIALICLVAGLAACASLPAFCDRVMGEITRVTSDTVEASFPVPVLSRSMMMILTGQGESIAGMAIAQTCEGKYPPYTVAGSLYLTMDSVHLTAGKKVYVNSINTTPAPSPPCPKPASIAPSVSGMPSDQDLRLYYYAGGQTVGYGALGLGYERTVRVARTVGVQLDGGITGIGSVSEQSADVVNTDQLIESLDGRVKLDLGDSVGIYSGYRWNQGRGDSEHWSKVVGRMQGKDFVASSTKGEGIVQTQGIEYGFVLQPSNTVSLLGGYIPKYRADFGSLGVLCEPAYTAELRFGFAGRTLRLRGLRASDYWIADLGVTIR